MDTTNQSSEHKMLYRYEQYHRRTASGRPVVRPLAKGSRANSREYKARLTLAALGLGTALFFWAAASAHAQDRKAPPAAGASMAEIPAEKEGASQASFMKQTNLRAGLFLSPSVPLGNLGEVVGTSFVSFYAFAWMDIPKPWLKMAMLDVLYTVGLQASAGFRLGITSYSSKSSFSDFVDESRVNDTASVTTIPILFPLRVGYPLKVAGYGVTPYGVLGFGLTMSSTSVDSNGQEAVSSSSVDGSLLLGVGGEVTVLKMVSAYLELNYLLAAQKVSGSFFQVHLGASYSFDP